MLTLTVAEIKDLAECAGLVFNQKFMPDGDDLDTEIVVMECPKEGVRDYNGKPTHYAHIAYFADYPEEGSHPLGPELTPPNAELNGRSGEQKALQGTATIAANGRVDRNVRGWRWALAIRQTKGKK